MGKKHFTSFQNDTQSATDTARDIYKNSTMENAALIRFVLAREQADITGKQRWDTQISASMNDLGMTFLSQSIFFRNWKMLLYD